MFECRRQEQSTVSKWLPWKTSFNLPRTMNDKCRKWCAETRERTKFDISTIMYEVCVWWGPLSRPACVCWWGFCFYSKKNISLTKSQLFAHSKFQRMAPSRTQIADECISELTRVSTRLIFIWTSFEAVGRANTFPTNAYVAHVSCMPNAHMPN